MHKQHNTGLPGVVVVAFGSYQKTKFAANVFFFFFFFDIL